MSTESIADQIKFAYWVPNVSGGLVTSTIEQRTSWDYDYNIKLARPRRTTASSTPSRRYVTRPATAPNTSTSRPVSASPCCSRRSG
ncbi:hypothetical protein BPODLACK_01804 [Gordonia sp. YY1]|nr:hypothetical protein BPODLACK_01804 [Gordonia sp. YY1]